MGEIWTLCPVGSVRVGSPGLGGSAWVRSLRVVCALLVIGAGAGGLSGCAVPRPLGRVYTHVVAPGESVWEISRRYGVSVSAVARYNRLRDPSSVRPGQQLRIPVSGRRGFSRGRRPTSAVQSQRTAAPPRAALPRSRAGRPRTPRPALRPGLPRVPEPPRRDAPQRDAPRLAQPWIWPVRGQLSSGFGWRRGRQHSGIDIVAPAGTPVIAAAPGRVIHSGRGVTGYGNLVVVRHSRTQVSVYAHHRRNLVRVGEWVDQGRVLAEVGQTGRATGPHLHFEIRSDGIALNPLEFLP